jgi:hypothetical protein
MFCSCCYIKYDITAAQKKGQITEVSPSTLHLKATSGMKSNVMRPIKTQR